MQGRGKADRPAGRRLAALLGALLLTFVTGACGSGGGGLETAGSDIAPESEDATTAAPETEDPAATEEPVAPEAEDVAVTLPGLPIGGGPFSSTDTFQCVDVGWSGPPDLPDWIGIAVTESDVAFDPDGAFALTNEPCETDLPHCFEGGVLITVSQRCYLAVSWTDPTLPDQGGLFFTAGAITCSADRAADCEQFRAEVESAGPQPADLDPPPFIEDQTTESETTESSGVEDGG